ncbi:hypothetical protein pb186bvf_004948 [Paramecium bursaria]
MDMIVSCTVQKYNSLLIIGNDIISIQGAKQSYQFQINLSLQLNWMDDFRGFTVFNIHVILQEQDGLQIFNLLASRVMYLNYESFFINGALLDKGGQSEGVYESFRNGEELSYATKILRKTAGSLLEIQLLNRFNHENIIKPRFFFQDEHKYYIVFEKLINLTHQKDEFQLQIYFRQILKAVEYIHQQGYIHRDIKPKNIMLNQNQQVQLIDLGLVVKQSSSELRQSGTIGYTAPEIFRGPFYTEKVDMFSLGAVFYELLSSKPLIDKHNTKVKNSLFKLKHYTFFGLSDLAQDLLMKLLIDDPNQRIDIQQSLNHAYFDQEDGAQISRRITPKLLSSLSCGIRPKPY